ncbi:type I restriction-modification system subunit M N-terminal domain-containing protein [Rubripirellula amarantea]|nr:type I restriction-modification system subunit M N-terminal domain-containing protein [Rubripirellula amarantea]
MALKKSQLYSSLWQSCDELRGGMDASQYKDYILTLLFAKTICLRLKIVEIPPFYIRAWMTCQLTGKFSKRTARSSQQQQSGMETGAPEHRRANLREGSLVWARTRCRAADQLRGNSRVLRAG